MSTRMNLPARHDDEQRRAVTDALMSAARGRLARPEDAAAVVDVDAVDVNESGQPDGEQVAAVIDEATKRWPALSSRPLDPREKEDLDNRESSHPVSGRWSAQGRVRPPQRLRRKEPPLAERVENNVDRVRRLGIRIAPSEPTGINRE